jgi:hypothetical protein
VSSPYFALEDFIYLVRAFAAAAPSAITRVEVCVASLLCFYKRFWAQWTVQNLEHIKFRSSKAVCQNSHAQIRGSQISHFSQNSAVFFQNSLSGPQTRVSVSQSANFLFFSFLFIYLYFYLFIIQVLYDEFCWK